MKPLPESLISQLSSLLSKDEMAFFKALQTSLLSFDDLKMPFIVSQQILKKCSYELSQELHLHTGSPAFSEKSWREHCIRAARTEEISHLLNGANPLSDAEWKNFFTCHIRAAFMTFPFGDTRAHKKIVKPADAAKLRNKWMDFISLHASLLPDFICRSLFADLISYKLSDELLIFFQLGLHQKASHLGEGCPPFGIRGAIATPDIFHYLSNRNLNDETKAKAASYNDQIEQLLTEAHLYPSKITPSIPLPFLADFSIDEVGRIQKDGYAIDDRDAHGSSFLHLHAQIKPQATLNYLINKVQDSTLQEFHTLNLWGLRNSKGDSPISLLLNSIQLSDHFTLQAPSNKELLVTLQEKQDLQAVVDLVSSNASSAEPKRSRLRL